MNSNTLSAKPHYAILDGLRGVAAVLVVAFHMCEANGPDKFTQYINHGYLAVDFFYVLSGFVIGYAYDDRWTKISITEFYKRRIIRLQPMVIMGMIVGAICFYFQKSDMFPLIAQTPVWKMLLIMLIGFTLIPVPISWDIRGWQEMHPLDGPGWSLFFEYIANILYAIGVRKFSKTALSILVLIAAAFLIHYTVTSPNGDVIGGWAIDPLQLKIGFIRLMYPFFAGLLLSRVAKITHVKNAFLWCTLLIAVVLSVPRLGGTTEVWKNGLYEALVIIIAFPLIVYIGASGDIKSAGGKRICKFLGDISYPIYITHYPLNYIYTSWILNNKAAHTTIGWAWAGAELTSAIILAYIYLKLYDEPVRKWLTKKWLNKAVSQ
jgi:peptidoglycan/LPS O-acetylase OafA/YrhL